MKIRSFNLNNSDYEMTQKWAESRNLNRVEKTRLSDYGFVAYNSDKEIAACFLYPFKGSEWCMFEFLIANPETTSEERKIATNKLFLHICNEAKNMGYKEIFTTSHLDNVSNTLNDIGFIKSNINVNHFIGRLV